MSCEKTASRHRIESHRHMRREHAMAKYEKEKDIGITFGAWRLSPCSGANVRNWELYRNGSSTGRYYQYDTLANALRYAADDELKRGCADKAIPIREALDRLESILSGFEERMKEALDAR